MLYLSRTSFCITKRQFFWPLEQCQEIFLVLQVDWLRFTWDKNRQLSYAHKWIMFDVVNKNIFNKKYSRPEYLLKCDHVFKSTIQVCRKMMSGAYGSQFKKGPGINYVCPKKIISELFKVNAWNKWSKNEKKPIKRLL